MSMCLRLCELVCICVKSIGVSICLCVLMNVCLCVSVCLYLLVYVSVCPRSFTSVCLCVYRVILAHGNWQIETAVWNLAGFLHCALATPLAAIWAASE